MYPLGMDALMIYPAWRAAIGGGADRGSGGK